MKQSTTLENNQLLTEIFLVPSQKTIENRFSVESKQAGCDGIHCSSGGGCVGFLDQ